MHKPQDESSPGLFNDATHPSFCQALDYIGNREVKSSGAACAMANGSRFGCQEQ